MGIQGGGHRCPPRGRMMEGRIMGKETIAAPALQHRDGGQETKTARGRRSRSYDYSTQISREVQSVRREYYQAVKERVPVPEAARHYGFNVNRAGFISCPFHAERTPSLKLRPAGWKCGRKESDRSSVLCC